MKFCAVQRAVDCRKVDVGHEIIAEQSKTLGCSLSSGLTKANSIRSVANACERKKKPSKIGLEVLEQKICGKKNTCRKLVLLEWKTGWIRSKKKRLNLS